MTRGHWWRRWWHRRFGHTRVVDLGQDIRANVLMHCPDCGATWLLNRDKDWVR